MVTGVKRCPSCGRAWDGVLCMACGHEAAPPARQATQQPAASSSSSSSSSAATPAAVPSVEPTKTVTPVAIPAAVASLPIPPATKQVIARAWQGPGAFAGLFVLGFAMAFLLGALITWRGHDPAALLAEGRVDDALTVIGAARSPSADWRRIEGHALHAKGDLTGMLLAYQQAVTGDTVDDVALQNTIDALGNEQTASLAVKTLEDWPGGAKVDDLLLMATTDPVWLRRHRATAALDVRASATPILRLQAAVKNAVADTRSDVCEHKLAGVKALYTLADQPDASPLLKKAGAWNAVYDLNDAVIMNFTCLAKDVVRRTETALAKVERE